MAHLWQAFAVDASLVENKGLPNDDVTDPNFQTRVLNFISGEGTQEPTDVGPSVDWTLFNKANDNTMLVIHAPSVWTWDSSMGQDKRYAQYANKMAAVASLVEQKIPGAQTILHLYKQLNYRGFRGADGEIDYEGPDAARVDNSALGFNIFQFDGFRWRLFAEYDIWNATGPIDVAPYIVLRRTHGEILQVVLRHFVFLKSKHS